MPGYLGADWRAWGVAAKPSMTPSLAIIFLFRFYLLLTARKGNTIRPLEYQSCILVAESIPTSEKEKNRHKASIRSDPGVWCTSDANLALPGNPHGGCQPRLQYMLLSHFPARLPQFEVRENWRHSCLSTCLPKELGRGSLHYEASPARHLPTQFVVVLCCFAQPATKRFSLG